MREIRTEIEIAASPAEVWAVLTDFGRYRVWNPFIVEAAGTLAVGETLTLSMSSGGAPPREMTPTVIALRENAELRWRGVLWWPWVFGAEHRFVLTENGAGTRLVHSERFFGVLVPLLGRLIAQTERDFRDLNAALKERVELSHHD
jgi:hypothetical protein